MEPPFGPLNHQASELDAYVDEMHTRDEYPIIVDNETISQGAMTGDYYNVTFKNVTFGDPNNPTVFPLSGDFQGCKFEDCTFLGNTSLIGDFMGATFDDCKFTPSDPYAKKHIDSFDSKANFQETLFNNCDLATAHLRGNFNGTTFTDCNMAHASFEDGHWNTRLDNVEFNGAELNIPNLSFNKATYVEDIHLPQDSNMRMIRLDSPTLQSEDIRESRQPIEIQFQTLAHGDIPYHATATIQDPRQIIESDGHYYLTHYDDKLDVTLTPIFQKDIRPETQSLTFEELARNHTELMLARGTYSDDPKKTEDLTITINDINNVQTNKCTVESELANNRGQILNAQIHNIPLKTIDPDNMTVQLEEKKTYLTKIPAHQKTGTLTAERIAQANHEAQAIKDNLINFGLRCPKGPNGPIGPAPTTMEEPEV